MRSIATRPTALRRRAARTVLDRVFDCLARWLAPVLCFTAEEAWLCRHGDGDDTSVHLELYPEVPARWRDEALGAKWAAIRELRRVVTGALELERAQKRMGSSLQAAVEVVAAPAHVAALAGLDLAEICITSAATLHAGAPPDGRLHAGRRARRRRPCRARRRARNASAAGASCPRSARVAGHADLCRRCADVGRERGRARGGRGRLSMRLGLAVSVPRRHPRSGRQGLACCASSPAATNRGSSRVTPFVNFALVMNRGMSFGLFNTSQSLNAAVFAVVAAVIVVALVCLAGAGARMAAPGRASGWSSAARSAT